MLQLEGRIDNLILGAIYAQQYGIYLLADRNLELVIWLSMMCWNGEECPPEKSLIVFIILFILQDLLAKDQLLDLMEQGDIECH